MENVCTSSFKKTYILWLSTRKIVTTVCLQNEDDENKRYGCIIDFSNYDISRIS